MTEDLKLNVSEIFYQIQGEGARTGVPSYFVRLQGCTAKHACASSGIECDTEFESGKLMTLDEIAKECTRLNPDCDWVIFTGGEPLDQLTPPMVAWFKRGGFSVALETSGTKELAPEFQLLFDWVVVSPKVAEHILSKKFPSGRVSELRYVRAVNQSIPIPALNADTRYLSPHANGNEWNAENVRHCLDLVLANPSWRLSMQMHKLLGVR